MRRSSGWEHEFFDVEGYRVSSYHREGVAHPSDGTIDLSAEATVKLWVDGKRVAAVGEGNGPVNALDAALRRALNGRYPALERIHLTDFKVRILDTTANTGGGDPRAHRLHRRRIDVDDHRRVAEHHRRVVDGARRRRGFRSACTPSRRLSAVWPHLTTSRRRRRSPRPTCRRRGGRVRGWPTGRASSKAASRQVTASAVQARTRGTSSG